MSTVPGLLNIKLVCDLDEGQEKQFKTDWQCRLPVVPRICVPMILKPTLFLEDEAFCRTRETLLWWIKTKHQSLSVYCSTWTNTKVVSLGIDCVKSIRCLYYQIFLAVLLSFFRRLCKEWGKGWRFHDIEDVKFLCIYRFIVLCSVFNPWALLIYLVTDR